MPENIEGTFRAIGTFIFIGTFPGRGAFTAKGTVNTFVLAGTYGRTFPRYLKVLL